MLEASPQPGQQRTPQSRAEAAQIPTDEVSDDDYIAPRHIEPGCTCRIIRVDSSAITNIVKDGKVPLVTVEGSPTDLEKVDVHILVVGLQEKEPEIDYVAISHVRSDGLGNSRANALPSCVLVGLQEMVHAVHPTVPALFWMDTLCIPSDRVGKKIATRNIRRIFENASEVLVVNWSIRTSYAVTTEQRLDAIRNSSWPKRLWTVQEGAVARQLFFQCREGPVDLDKLQKEDVNMSYNIHDVLGVLSLLSDDLNGSNLRKWKGSLKGGLSSYADTKYQLRSLLRTGYLSLPRFRSLVSPEERASSPAVLQSLMSIYRGPSGNRSLNSHDSLLRRLESLREIAATCGEDTKAGGSYDDS